MRDLSIVEVDQVAGGLNDSQGNVLVVYYSHFQASSGFGGGTGEWNPSELHDRDEFHDGGPSGLGDGGSGGGGPGLERDGQGIPIQQYFETDMDNDGTTDAGFYEGALDHQQYYRSMSQDSDGHAHYTMHPLTGTVTGNVGNSATINGEVSSDKSDLNASMGITVNLPNGSKSYGYDPTRGQEVVPLNDD